ncbi:hypothetical protein CHS0354_002944 [Potamilus streckersoni]|uniref:DZIP3-like HEPN domain-containing protein n=1 Tax=Potamilus streckersoni TaxID=2493646 RepID=A0AAE0VIA2_9BIVA|nr:hypothetical protein CHS0354_002944 [Potamilus streckersoni]
MIYNRLYPQASSTPVSSENFDISLLTCLFRNICGLNPPKTGWDDPPLQGDTSLEADVVRIRLIRNEVQHITTASLSDQDFPTKWNEIEQVLTRLGSGCPDIIASINKLKTDAWDAEKEKGYPDVLQVWMDSDTVLRDRVEDVNRRTSTLEAEYKDLSHTVIQHIHSQDTAIRRVESEIIYLRKKDETQTIEVTSSLEALASHIEAIEKKEKKPKFKGFSKI